LPKTLILLIIADLFPLLGMYLWHWDLNASLIYYWFETLIFTFWVLVRLIHVRSFVFLIAFLLPAFIILLLNFFWYFDLSTAAYDTWKTVRNGAGWEISGNIDLSRIYAWLAANRAQILTALISFNISHGISYVKNFVIDKEYGVFSGFRIFWIGLARLFANSIVVFICMDLFIRYSFVMFGVFLIIAKILIDIVGHIFEHLPKPKLQITTMPLFELVEKATDDILNKPKQ
ncbi:MAG: DUF6498-containing protein, partial [bacterium]|nr:DUF6498-containing protein [bacterium]